MTPHTSQTYAKTVLNNGKKRRVLLPLVKIVVQIDGTSHEGTEWYEQEKTAYEKINELYEYYYNRANLYL